MTTSSITAPAGSDADSHVPALDVPALDVRTVVAALTLEEKAGLCSGRDMWHTKPVERLGVPAVFMTDGPHGLRAQSVGEDETPSIGDSAPATCFPPAVALGSSWNARLVGEVGAAIGAEARAQGVEIVLGPGVNIKRSPLCGRNFEYLSEDPALTGVLASAFVDGLQGQGVGASLKHFAANNQETDRMRVSAEVDERTLREIYLPGFERVVTSVKPWTIMCSYNRVNGVLASQHPWLLTTVLREEWGFDGVVMSDWGAVADRVPALAAGLDLEMPSSHGVTDAQLVAAVRAGELDEAVLDLAVTRLLELVARTRPAAEAAPDDAEAGHTEHIDHAEHADAHHALARRAAAECAVLLRNDGGLLPLAPDGTQRIAVVGEFARTPRYQGAGSSQVNSTRVDDALTALRAVAGERVTFAPGFLLDGDGDPDGADSLEAVALRAEAVEAARAADVVVAFLGLPRSAESEGFDRTHLHLPPAQLALVAELAAANPALVVVLSNGSAVQLAGWEHHARAVLEGWLLGQAGGSALADVLFGFAEPGGRLAETIPLALGDVPSSLSFPGECGTVRYGEGLFVGYRGFDATGRAVSYPFGHGLSYTTFDWSDVEVHLEPGAREIAQAGTVDLGGTPLGFVSVTVTNTGARTGSDVVQLYVGDPSASVARPVRELKAFAKVTLEPGASTRVRLPFTARDLSYWHPAARRWVLEPGAFTFELGASSRDLRLSATVTLDTDPFVLPLHAESTLDEALAHPVAGAVVASMLPDHGPFADPELRMMLGSMPLARLLDWPGSPLTHEQFGQLLEQVNAAG